MECRPERSKHKVETMKLNFILAAAAAAALAGCSSFPGSESKQTEEHEKHHPAAETAPKVDQTRFDQQMTTIKR